MGNFAHRISIINQYYKVLNLTDDLNCVIWWLQHSLDNSGSKYFKNIITIANISIVYIWLSTNLRRALFKNYKRHLQLLYSTCFGQLCLGSKKYKYWNSCSFGSYIHEKTRNSCTFRSEIHEITRNCCNSSILLWGNHALVMVKAALEALLKLPRENWLKVGFGQR